ncbi:SDR family oxidoreductase [Natronomonas sp. F2-12]|uniref:SDR family oxidoreductase n=1 Tax=Natronomonas aquatica TaxID=2841590 RepID=A0A9R1CQJ6_9EURY|nr:SDR family oxidoreductase [Natronomonas aquatica]MCQ4332222.1 SDR family oxidoreductase [Natronomonas aquatica]
MTGSQPLEGKTVLLTGASAGIGRATAREVAAAGGDVALAARREERLQELAEELESEHGVGTLVAPTDVRDSDAVAETVARTVEEFGGLDVAVCNAGLIAGSAIEDLPDEEYHRMMDVNTDGVFFTARESIPHLRESEGHVVIVGSFAGQYPRPFNPVYAASKSWARSFAHSLEAQVGEEGIAVSVVNPTEVRSEFGDGSRMKERYGPEEASDPGDIAEAIVFAATREQPNTVSELDLYRPDKFSGF